MLSEAFARRGNDVDVLLAVLAHDVGKGSTPADELPSHHGHASRGTGIAAQMRERLGLSRDRQGVMSTAAGTHINVHRVADLTATTLLDVAKQIRASPLSVDQLVDVVAADATGRTPVRAFPAKAARRRLTVAVDVLDDIGGSESLARRDIDPSAVGEDVPGERIGNFVRQDRAEALRARL